MRAGDWIDVSMPLFPGMPTFPGDPEFASAPCGRSPEGARFALSRITLGSHAGTHLDPPSHFFPGGRSVDQIPLDLLNGPCLVVEAGAGGETVERSEVEPIPAGVTRVLFRTPNSARWADRLELFSDFTSLGLAAARLLCDRGVRLVALDALSVDASSSSDYPVHRKLLSEGVVILEGLLLAEAPARPYDLACLPLRVRGGDGAPARAAVRPIVPGQNRSAAPGRRRGPNPARPAGAGRGSRPRWDSRPGTLGT